MCYLRMFIRCFIRGGYFFVCVSYCLLSASSYIAKKGSITFIPQTSWQAIQAASTPLSIPILPQFFGQTGARAGTQYVPFFISGTGTYDQATATVVDSYGRIVTGGLTLDGVGVSHFAVARFLPTGQLDTSFGQVGAKAGTQYIPFTIAGGLEDIAAAMVLDGQGNIILAGLSRDGGGVQRFALARFLPTGQLDSSFGQSGPKAGTQFISFSIAGGTTDIADGVCLDSQGRILVGGTSFDAGVNGHFAIARFLSTGQLDTTFGQAGAKGGTQYIPFTIAAGTADTASAIAVGSEDNIFLGGYSYGVGGYSRFAVAKFLSTGQLDSSFGQEGAKAGTQFISFSIAGGVTDQAYSLAIDRQSNLVLVGSATTNVDVEARFAIARFLPTGQLDASFGQAGEKAGTQYIPFTIAGGTDDIAYGVALDALGNIVLAGNSIDGIGKLHFAIARFFSTGQLDASFGQAGTRPGTQYIPFGICGTDANDTARALAFDTQGNIVLGGYSVAASGGESYFALAKFLVPSSLVAYNAQYPTAGGFY